jgi:hypothetical protein
VNDIRQRLREHDPARHAPALSERHVRDIRRRACDAARAQPRGSRRPRRLEIAVVTAALVTIGVVSMRKPSPAPQPEPRLVQEPEVAPAVARRQLQFVAPGGTRIVWTVNDSLNLSR